MNDLTELRRVAEGGIEGPCKAVMSTYVTFDPPTVLALIDELERLRGVVEEVRELAGEWDDRQPNPWPKRGQRRTIAACLETHARELRRILDGRSERLFGDSDE